MTTNNISLWTIAIVGAKVGASILVVMATIGLLWHPTPGIALGELGGRAVPAWIATAALGWYQDVLNNIVPLLRRSLLLAAAYGSVSILCVFSLFGAAFIRNNLARVCTCGLLVVGLLYYLIMFEVGGTPPSLGTTYTIFANAKFGLEGGTASLYSGAIAANTAFLVLVFVIFAIPPPRLPRTWRWLPGSFIVLAISGVAAILWRTSGYTSAFPAPFSSFIDAYQALQMDRDQSIASVLYPGQPESPFQKIVLIMDESMRADIISLNNPAAGTTPFLASRSSAIVNFGVAVSAANCSTLSRMAVRYGWRERDVAGAWSALRHRTTFWQYAHRAGFKTIYIDTVGTPALPYYGMTATELGLVDERIIVTGQPLHARDAEVAERLKKLLHSPGRMFIYVEKYGTHVPYDQMYPAKENVFGADLTAPFRLENRDQLLKHYKNAVRWSVDQFFSVVLSEPLPPEALVLYTSDHGQSLSEGHTLQTHCTAGEAAAKSEGAVPLFAMTSDLAWQRNLSRAASANFDRASQYEIVPTLLSAMGYSSAWVADNFDGTLLEPVATGRRRRFMTGGAREPLRNYDE